MNIDPHGFQLFMKEREEAARAYVTGNAEPVSRISTRTSPATFFGPGGGYLQGAAEVVASYERDAKAF